MATWSKFIRRAHRIWKADWTRMDRGHLSAGEHLACMRRVWRLEQLAAMETAQLIHAGGLFRKNVYAIRAAMSTDMQAAQPNLGLHPMANRAETFVPKEFVIPVYYYAEAAKRTVALERALKEIEDRAMSNDVDGIRDIIDTARSGERWEET